MSMVAVKAAGSTPAAASSLPTEKTGDPAARNLIVAFGALQVATFIRFARRKAKLKQEELAAKISLSQSRISRLENKARDLPLAAGTPVSIADLHDLELAHRDCTVSALVQIAEACGGKISLTFTRKEDGKDDTVSFDLNPVFEFQDQTAPVLVPQGTSHLPSLRNRRASRV